MKVVDPAGMSGLGENFEGWSMTESTRGVLLIQEKHAGLQAMLEFSQIGKGLPFKGMRAMV